MRARARALAATLLAVTLALVAGIGAAGCGGGGGYDAVRLGYLLNLTHGPAIIALHQEFKDGLAGLPVESQPFQAGPEEAAALLGGSLDAAYMGPAPYILAESRAPGRLRLLGGVVTGGQRLMATPGSGIRTLADLAGKKVAVPAHGNTQDLTLRLLLDQVGLKGDDQGGDVGIVPVKNSALGDALDEGAVDATLAPEPYVAKLEAKGKVVPVADANAMIEEWRIPATVLVVTEDFARAEPAATAALVAANAKAVARAQANPVTVARAFNALIEETTGKTVDEPVLLAALADMQATTGIAPGAMQKTLDAASVAGYLGGPVPPRALVPRPG